MTVLVLASEWDRTADSVVSGLTELGVPVMRLDLSWFPQRLTLDAEFRDGSWQGHLRTEHHEVDLASVRSVWVRTPSSFQMPEGMSAAEREFAKREAKLGVGGVLLALPDVLWVNRPDLAATAVYRPVQWATAARCGLTVPRTLVSNDPAAVSRFAQLSASGVVLKPLSTNLIYEDDTYKMGWTRTLSAADLADLRGIEVTAHLVQLSYEVTELPEQITTGLPAFMTELGRCTALSISWSATTTTRRSSRSWRSTLGANTVFWSL